MYARNSPGWPFIRQRSGQMPPAALSEYYLSVSGRVVWEALTTDRENDFRGGCSEQQARSVA